jgi:DNA-binding NtrC family response regulator
MSAKSTRRVLIVDDDEGARLSLGRIVRKAGYLAGFVSNARDAIAEICVAVPDIVFTDIHTPQTEGLELINWLRRASSSIPLIAMSGANKALTGQLSLATKLGACAAVSKPLLEKDVFDAIELAVAGRSANWPGRRWG